MRLQDSPNWDAGAVLCDLLITAGLFGAHADGVVRAELEQSEERIVTARCPSSSPAAEPFVDVKPASQNFKKQGNLLAVDDMTAAGPGFVRLP